MTPTPLLEDRLSLLSEHLLGLISAPADAQLQANVAQFKDQLSSLQSTDVGVDAEMVFRSSLDALLLQGGGSSGPSSAPICSFGSCSNQSRIVSLLNFAIELGKQCEQLSFNIPKIPFILIEDLLQCQTLVNAQLIWEIVESKVDTLTLPVLFNRGKFIILRTCNALLKRLSRSCHTEFCGRVLMFLASVYPLSEKSAVNLAGKVNVGNVTHFEDEDSFLSASAKDGAGESEESVDKQGGEMEVETPSGGGGGDSHVDYQLYKAFWEIQGFLASDPKVMDQKNKWPELMKSANMLLATFEADSGTSSELKQAKRRRQQEKEEALSSEGGVKQLCAMNNTGSSKDSRSEYRGCKYLTSSQLFLLELQDPSIRQQLAIQLLITLHYRLRNMPPETSKPTSVASAATAVDEEQLQALESRLYQLLQKTPSSCGDDLLSTLRSIFSSTSSSSLSREDGWLKWKQDHCPSFEKAPIIREELLKSGDLKRKRFEKHSGGSENSSSKGNYYFEHEWPAMQVAAQALTKQVPSLEAHIEDFVDAEDPEAGIEDEYHPKHDTVYCWRARRLMAAAKLSSFEAMAEGNVAKGLKILGMIPEPEPQQSGEKEEDDKEVDDKEEEEEMDQSFSTSLVTESMEEETPS